MQGTRDAVFKVFGAISEFALAASRPWERFLSVESSCASLSECHFGSQSHNEAFRGDGFRRSVRTVPGIVRLSVRKHLLGTPPASKKVEQRYRRCGSFTMGDEKTE